MTKKHVRLKDSRFIKPKNLCLLTYEQGWCNKLFMMNACSLVDIGKLTKIEIPNSEHEKL